VADVLRSFSIRSLVTTKETRASQYLLEAIITEPTSSFINIRFISRSHKTSELNLVQEARVVPRPLSNQMSFCANHCQPSWESVSVN
jgi:hypothetical protein